MKASELRDAWAVPVKITGAQHPHRGKTGTAKPQDEWIAGMVLVALDGESNGERACYAVPADLRRLPQAQGAERG